MQIYPIEVSQTASSGIWSLNSEYIKGGLIHQVYIKSATTTTTFDITITDEKDNIIYDTEELSKTATGFLNDFIEIPVRGIITIACANASADELFTGRISVEEH